MLEALFGLIFKYEGLSSSVYAITICSVSCFFITSQDLFATTMSLSTLANATVISERHKAFGLLGGFAGDDELLQEIAWCDKVFGKEQQDPTSSSIPQESFSRLIKLLNVLPWASRNALTIKVLAVSPLRDSLLTRLFDDCQLQLNDNDFVLLLTESTSLMDTSNKYHILQVCLMLLKFCSPHIAVDVCRRYCRSASTRYQGQFLSWAASKTPPDVFGNEELWQLFRDYSSGQVQREVLASLVKASSSSGSDSDRKSPRHVREDFLIEVLKETSHDARLVFYCSSDYLETQLQSNDNKIISTFGFCRWSCHEALYYKYIQKRLEEESNPLTRGTVWKQELQPALLKAPSGDIKSQHVHAMLNLLQACGPLEFATTTTLPQNVKVHIQELAQQGQDISIYQGIVQPVSSDALRALIPKKERIRTAIQAAVGKDWSTFECYKGLVRDLYLPFEATFQQATKDDLWSIITGRLHKAKNKTDLQCFLLHFATTDFNKNRDRAFTNNRDRAFTINALWEWQHWHIRSTPDKLSPQQVAKYVRALGVDEEQEQQEEILKTLWQHWYNSLTSRYLENGLVALTTSRVLDAKKKHRPQERSKITLDARYGHELLEIALGGMHALPAEYAVENQTILLRQLETLLGLYGLLKFDKSLVVVDNLNNELKRTVIDEFLPRLGKILQFDPKDTKRYISTNMLSEFRNRATWLTRSAMQDPSGQPVVDAFMSKVLSKVLADASAHNHHIPLPNGLKRFETVMVEERVKEGGDKQKAKIAYYESNLHAEAFRFVLSTIKEVLCQSKTRQQSSLWKEQRVTAWKMMMEAEFGLGREKIRDNPDRIREFLRFCRECLSTDLLKQETQAITEQARALAVICQKERGGDKEAFYRDMQIACQELDMLGLLTAVLESSVFDEDARKTLSSDNGFSIRYCSGGLQASNNGA